MLGDRLEAASNVRNKELAMRELTLMEKKNKTKHTSLLKSEDLLSEWAIFKRASSKKDYDHEVKITQ